MSNHGSITCSTHRLYGMECNEFDALHARSCGCCEVCGTPEEDAGLGRLVIDHDHRYGKEAVRGLICSSCNSRLSVLENYHPYRALAAEQRFETYLGRAWFAQVSRQARLTGELSYEADEDVQRVLSAALRSAPLRRTGKALRQQPELSIRRVEGPGVLRISVLANYQSATPSRYKIDVLLRRDSPTAILFESLRVGRQGEPTADFSDLTEGLRHVRALLKADRPVEVCRRAEPHFNMASSRNTPEGELSCRTTNPSSSC